MSTAGVDATNVTGVSAAAVGCPPGAAATSLTPSSVTPSVSYSQLTNAVMSQMYQKNAGLAPAAMSTMYGLAANPYASAMTPAYDPKQAMLASANKLKVMPSPAGVKLDQRFAPY